ncbi:integrating conjugative element protein (TIGR03755 family) [Pseudomonas sp. JUb42]|uniref:integrating conjugative element protein n=1 Tax=Pseudomonas sp. JUb42 TaxID=2940611 RepID=UPI0021688E70|nr:integrating conjugative element protein [Pseudomonas sp. JUb42]MCS3470097.1 integrating conjugative element protein (TIGR03755 family) [Pseudomonas sp. JUb42]
MNHFLLLARLPLLALFVSATAQAEPLNAQTSGSVIGDDVLYSIGGGNAVTMGRAGNMQSIGVGVGWNSNLMCGNMDLSTTLQNQLNGATDGFRNIMSSVIQGATGAVASLPALIIQRADPGVYNLLTNGILQARLDFDRAKVSCTAMTAKMADLAGNQAGWSALADGQALKEAVSRNPDAVAATKTAESSKGNSGVPWIGGTKAGGQGQQPIRVVSEVTKAGYNLLNSRSATDTSAISQGSCNSGMLCGTWKSPDEAAQFANRVLGEVEQQTCETCTKSSTTAGVGLTPLIQEEYDSKLQALQELISGSKETTPENLAAASSNSLPITRGVIAALKDEPDQELLAQRLASEVAVSSILEKALLLQRTLLAGNKEPNVSANDVATSAISQENQNLKLEIDNLKTELELRRTLASNSPMAIISRYRERQENSRSIYQGETDMNRLEDAQKATRQDNP